MRKLRLRNDYLVAENRILRPDTILAWHRKLVARTFDGSKQRKSVGRSRVGQ